MPSPTPKTRLRLEPLEERLLLNGAVVYVDDDFGPATPGWGVTHFARIQDGIDATGTNDTIYVAAGVYSERVRLGSENDGTVLQGAGADVTIIDGGGSGTVLRLRNFDGGRVAGFTIRNGSASNGGGISAESADSVIAACLITDNEADMNGGGLYISGGAPLIINSVFTGNTALFGAALYVDDAEPDIINNTIYGNEARSCGGAIYGTESIFVLGNSILWANESADLFPNDEIMLRSSAQLAIRYCIIQDGTDEIYAWMGASYSYDATNSEDDPEFVNAPEGNFRLQSDSPAIDAAHGNRAPETDHDGNPRVDDPLTENTGYGTPDYADIGAFEFVAIVDNDPPAVGSLLVAPDTVTRPESLTLTALDVTDPDGDATVAGVSFYRDANGNGTFEPGVDVLIGTDTDGSDGWSWTGSTAGWPTGNPHTFFAQARDNYTAYSTPVAATAAVLNAPPTTDSLSGRVSGGLLTLSATASDDEAVTKVQFYLDADGDGVFQPETDTILGNGILSGGTWRLAVNVAAWADGTYTLFARAQDGAAEWSDPASTEAVIGHRYVGRIADPFSGAYVDVYAHEDVALETLLVGFAGGGVASVQLTGAAPMDGLGLLIRSEPWALVATSVKDSRKGARSDVAFIASNGPFKAIQLKCGLAGYNLNGLTLGDFTFDADIDGDGDIEDLTGIHTTAYAQKIQFAGQAGADVWVGGVDPRKGLSVSSFANKTGGYHGDLVTVGGVGSIKLSGSLGSGLSVGGSLKSLQVKNGPLGGTIRVGGALGKVAVSGGSITADMTVNGFDPKNGRSVGSLQAKNGHFSGSLTAAGGVGKVSISNGDYSGSVEAGGGLSSLQVKGKTTGGWLRAGSSLIANGFVGKVQAGRYETDNGGEAFGLLADGFGSIALGGLSVWPGDLPFTDGDFRIELRT